MRNGKLKISVPHQRIVDFCRKNHITKLAFFGSVLRDDFSRKSDVDILVKFDRKHIPGLEFFDMERELSKILKRKVDLNTPGFLGPVLRKRIEQEAVIEYARFSYPTAWDYR